MDELPGPPGAPIVASFGTFVNKNLEECFRVLAYSDVTSESTVLSKVDGVVLGKVVSTDPEFINNILPKMTNLKIAMPQGIGYDYMEHLFPYLKERGITVGSNSGEVASASIADFTMALLIAVARKIFQADAFVRQGQTTDMGKYHQWTHSILSQFKHVTGSTMGVVGMGSIGLAIAKRAHHGFDMKILYNNRSRRSVDDEEKVAATYYNSLADMLPLCDFVVIACDLNQQSQNLFTKEKFRCMKKSAILINIARGAIVDTSSMVEALKSGQLGGAGLEVTHPEPLPRDHPLREMENVVITPHMASTLKALRLERNRSILGQLKSVIVDKQPLKNPIV